MGYLTPVGWYCVLGSGLGSETLGAPGIPPPRVRGVQVGYGFTWENVIVVTLPRAVKSTPGRGFIISIGGQQGGDTG